MSLDLSRQIKRLTKKYKTRRRWTAAVSCLGAAVVVATAFVLTRPAITQENVAHCALEEHVHTEQCYGAPGVKLLCSGSQLAGHTHTDSCYSGGVLACGYSDFVLHTHSAGCYDANGTFVCTLREIKEHHHDDGCYESYCTISEEDHVHTDPCYTLEKTDTLVCEPAHTHGEGCYTVTTETICQEEHEHTGDCVKEVSTLACTLSTEPHEHTDACYGTKKILTCTQHVHGEDCVKARRLVCGKSEIYAHTHTAECFVKDQLVCGLTQTLRHNHSDSCMEALPAPLTCTLTEHTHSSECYQNPDYTLATDETTETTVETTAETTAEATTETTETTSPEEVSELPLFLCGMEQHAHADDCYSNKGELICTLEEHRHDPSCLLSALLQASPINQTSPTSPLNMNDLGSLTFDAQISHNGGLSFEPFNAADTNQKLNEDDRLKLILNFNIDGNKLPDDGVAIYTVPENLRGALVDKDGELYITNSGGGSLGSVAGTYKIDRTTGQIILTFNSDFVNRNQSGNGIHGNVYFECDIGRIQQNEDGTISIPANQNTTHNFQVDRRPPADMNVEKSIVKGMTPDDMTITYEIKVSSIQGTADMPAILKDQLHNSNDYQFRDATITKNGNAVDVPAGFAQDFFGNGYDLGTMAANDEYVIQYTMQYTGNNGQMPDYGVWTSNTINGYTKWNDQLDLQDQATISQYYTKDPVPVPPNPEKSYTYDADTGKITWTVLVQSPANDTLEGWTLKDMLKLSGVGTTGVDYQLKDADGNPVAGFDGSTFGTDGYTFTAGQTGPYTLTYTQNLGDTLQEVGGEITNNVWLEYPGNWQKPGDEVVISNKPLVQKSKGSITVTPADSLNGNATAEMSWTVEIAKQSFENNGLPMLTPDASDELCWWYADTMTQNNNGSGTLPHYMTAQQWAELETTIAALMAGQGVSSDKYTLTQTTVSDMTGRPEGSEIIGFTIRCTKEVNAFQFTYHSTAVLTAPVNQNNKLENTGTYNGRVSKSDSYWYNTPKPTLLDLTLTKVASKPDMINSGNTFEPMQWTVKLEVPLGYQPPENAEPYVLTEHLPDNVDIQAIDFQIFWMSTPNIYTQAEGLRTTQISYGVDGTGYLTNDVRVDINLAMNGSDLELSIDPGVIRMLGNYRRDDTGIDRSIRLVIKAMPRRDSFAPDPNSTYYVTTANNSVSLTGNGENDQKTAPIKYTWNKDGATLSKASASIEEGGTKIVGYSVKINPKDEDLVPNSDVLHMVDTVTLTAQQMEYIQDFGLYSNANKPDVYKVGLYYMNLDGTAGAAVPGFHYEYSNVMNPNGSWQHHITADIPDGVAMVLKYYYRMDVKLENTVPIINTVTGIQNTVTLSGESNQKWQTETWTDFQHHSTAGSAQLQGLSITKTEQGDSTKFVDGAVFEIYKWVNDAFVLEATNTTVNGSIVINDIQDNTAYYIKEIQAPAGYLLDSTPIYFYALNRSQTNYFGPDEFLDAAQRDQIYRIAHVGGNGLNVTNQANRFEISVHKIFLEEDGTTVIDPATLTDVSLIQFKLFKEAVDSSGNVVAAKVQVPSAHPTGYFTLDPGNNWRTTITGLEKYLLDDKGNIRGTYRYTVEEDPTISGFICSNGDPVTCDSPDKEITITNTRGLEGFELPKTGSIGTAPFTLAGLLLCGAAMLIYRGKRKKEGSAF